MNNTWDEICVQVQDQESVYWDAYLDVAFSLIKSEINKLDNETKNAIWLQTRSGSDWVNNCEMLDDIDFDEEEVLEYLLHNYVLSAAADFTNKRIEKYLYNFT